MNKSSKIYVAGHNGLVGSAIVRSLKRQGYTNIVFKSHSELDLLDQDQVESFLKREKPEYIFLAAAKVGGILANKKYPAEFIYSNLQIQNNIIHLSWKHKVKKLLFLGSSCIYPKFAKQPIKEEYLLTGELESTNEPYAIAKIAGIKMCQSYNRQYGTNFIAVMPTNLYGPNDNFDLETSHVLPALIRKFHEAKINNKKEVILWGTGKPRRELMYVDDMADACVHIMNKFNPTKEQNEAGDIFLNVGVGEDISIKDLAELIKNIIGYKGNIVWDDTKPDGTPRKLLDVTKLRRLGYKHKTTLEEGIINEYTWFKENY